MTVVAKARYTGRGQRVHYAKCPSGEKYRFAVYTTSRPWTSIESVEDAKYLSEQSNIEVEWDLVGRIVHAGESIAGILSDMVYAEKRKLASDIEERHGVEHGLEGNPSGDDLEAALQDQLKQLQERGEL